VKTMSWSALAVYGQPESALVVRSRQKHPMRLGESARQVKGLAVQIRRRYPFV
jgi:hypothetical protein